MSASGLNKHQRIIARERTTQAALLSLHHAAELHYTMGSERWEGITQHLVAQHGHYPKHADCSAFATWCLWNGLYVPFKVNDVVNRDSWNGGYTGTMAQHGLRVQHEGDVIRGDCVLYGPKPTYEHVAIVVGRHKGKLMVVSNGSEPGPFLLPFDYRSDVGQIRRYI
jgi:cell wall-associated NlpC family hydrolase